MFADSSTGSDGGSGVASTENGLVPENVVTGFEWNGVDVVAGRDYSFFNLDLAGSTNAWAGAKHWKYATLRTAIATENCEQGVDKEGNTSDDKNGSVIKISPEINESKAGKNGGKSLSKKQNFKVDFDLRLAADQYVSAFAVEAVSEGKKAKADPSQLTKSSVQRLVTKADEGPFFNSVIIFIVLFLYCYDTTLNSLRHKQ